MVKSGKSFVKTGSRFQIALFKISYLPSPTYSAPPPHLISPNAPTPTLITIAVSFGTQEYMIRFSSHLILNYMIEYNWI